MSWYLESMKSLLSEADARWLRAVWAPTVVGVPPSDALRSLCVMPDGEIRAYGERNKTTVRGGSGEAIYLASRDCGLSWKAYPVPPGALGASVRSPYSGKYISLRNVTGGEAPGLYVFSSDVGPDDPSPARRRIDPSIYQVILPPVAMVSRRRFLCPMHFVDERRHYHPVIALSDDDGESWTLRHLPAAPDHTVSGAHRGLRWQNSGAEPCVAEMPDGRLMLLARTSLDVLYVYESFDGGDTWTEGAPSDFHATLTTPAFLRLSDGRVVLFWCNTQPLPELDHTVQRPLMPPSAVSGLAEDVFTNRDANHAAVTADGVHWQGFREVFLSEIRHRADFRTCGGAVSSADKSVHQFQALELPYGKILLAFGQHEISRRMVVFDADWLTEKTRREDFSRGLDGISTHVYVNSISGTALYWKQRPGHCAWNRTYGALLVPDPDETWGEVLQICRIRDPRLVSETQGAVWNFPAARSGTVTIEMRVGGAGVAVSLTDRWYNVIDETVRAEAPFSLPLDRTRLAPDVWHTVRIRFDTARGAAAVDSDGAPLGTFPLRAEAPHGICYLHLQSLAGEPDGVGTYIRSIAMQSEDAPDDAAQNHDEEAAK